MHLTAALAMSACALALVGCGPRPAARDAVPVDPVAETAAALNPCDDGGDAFARAVCANPQLAALEGELRAALAREAADVSEAGRQALVESQQRWLQAQRTACGIIDPDAAPSAVEIACLRARLADRTRQAAGAVEQLGGYTFQRMEIVSAQAVTAEAAAASGLGESAPPAITRDIRFPRMDEAATPQAARFNALVAQQPQYRLEDQTEEQVTYRIAYAGPALISVRFDLYESSLGAAHPNTSARAVNVVMTTGQPLTAGDVFRAGSGWENFLVERATRALTRQFRDQGFEPPEADVRDTVTKPHLWLITEQGLVLLFPPYSFGGPYALGDAEVAVPWADLARFLNPNAPAPIRRSS